MTGRGSRAILGATERRRSQVIVVVCAVFRYIARESMVKVRCFKCGNAFQLTEQYIANELAVQGIEKKPAHYVAECPNCRQANKVSLRRVRLPVPEVPVEEESQEEA